MDSTVDTWPDEAEEAVIDMATEVGPILATVVESAVFSYGNRPGQR